MTTLYQHQKSYNNNNKYMKSFFTITIFLLISSSIQITKADFFHDFWKPVFTNAPKFSGSQLYSIDNIGFQGYDGTVKAFGDFNVFLWNIEDWKYDPSDIIIQLNSTQTITNVIPGDFSYDGKLDVLIQGLSTAENTQQPQFMSLFKGDYESVSSLPFPLPSPSPVDQVLALDINGDLHIDLFGVNDQQQRTLWVNRDGEYSTQSMPNVDETFGPVSSPHSNSFLDFNGDCLADLFVTSVQPDGSLLGEIWINQKDNGYVPYVKSFFPLPKGVGQITFSDFDGDGDLDMLYPVCWPANNCSEVNSIYLVYNSQKPVCPSALFGNAAKCRPQNDLCLADNNFQFSSTTSEDNITQILTKEAFGDNVFFSNLSAGVPLIIHSGDYNIDGYPDLLISFYKPSNDSDDPPSPHIELWENVPCTPALCGSTQSSQSGRRTFSRVTSGTDALTQIENAYSAVFVDLGENGIPDILVLTNGNATAPAQVKAVFNNFYNDAFFFKTLGLNGVCVTMCPTSPKFPNPKPYGVNFPGGTFKFTYSDLSGSTHIQIGAQLYQSSYMSLQTPYNLFGLGRTSNYVDQLFFGLPLNQTVHYNNWVGTIPNSQVVAIPYKSSNPSGWILELFINPSGIFFWVLIAFFASLIILAGVSFFLYKREKKQDEKIKQEQAHLFYFNAL
eukprot:gene6111-7615_t